MRPSNNRVRVLALSVTIAGMVSGCASYFDRRDTISLDGGDAMASNRVTHVVDPWPRESADRNIAFNGERMQRAVERYRTNRVIPPRGAGTSTTYGEAPEASAAEKPNNTSPVGPTVTQSSVK
jgi:hypothetical protein